MRSKISQRLTRLALGVVIGYIVVLVVAGLGQRRHIFPRTASRGLPVGGETWSVSFEGGTVPVWAVGNPTEPDAPLVVWFHGNAEQLADTTWHREQFVRRGFSFAAVEYPGYGNSTGVGPSESSILAAARATMRSLSARYRGVVCVGASLGTGVAAVMAAEGACKRLVLVSPYTSLADAAQAMYPFLPARWLVVDRLDTAAIAVSIRVPTLIVHGTDDRTCPIWMGRQLAVSIPGARLVETAAGHQNVLSADVVDLVADFAQ